MSRLGAKIRRARILAGRSASEFSVITVPREEREARRRAEAEARRAAPTPPIAGPARRARALVLVLLVSCALVIWAIALRSM